MDLLFLFVLITLCSVVQSQQSSGQFFNVLDHGAVGDGYTDDTQAFMKAWNATCESLSPSPTMHIPKNKTFFLNPLTFKGPCKSANLHVEINGYIIAPSHPSHWVCDHNVCDKWLNFKHIDGLSVKGSGTIDGRGNRWWKLLDRRRPTAMEITNSNNVSISGLSFKNNPHVHLIIDGSTWVYASNISIDSPGSSPNTDGIHITGSTNVFIDHCKIRTGDDCISIVDGSSYLNINNITCGPGHGISIGSLGKGGSDDTVEYVHVSDVLFVGATNGARIKTWQGGKGHARHIIFERITTHLSDNPILIDQYYCDHTHCITQASAVQVSNITFSQIKGTSRRKMAVKLACSESVPCRDIFMDNINIRARHGGNASSSCNNAYGIARGEMVPEVPCLIQT